MKIFFLYAISIILLATSTIPFAASSQGKFLTLDMRNVDKLPKNFRTSSDNLSDSLKINKTGLRELHIAGSGQFSVLAFKQAIDRLPAESILVIDLRQESHGFLNGNAVSWYANNNTMNAAKTPQEIEIAQPLLLDDLRHAETVSVNQLAGVPVEFAVHQVMSELDLMHHYRIAYERIYVQDHHAPSNAEVDRFIHIINQTPNETWVYFHCRAGMGRTSTFMLMYDMMHYAKQISFKDLLARQAALGGKDLATLPSLISPKYKAAQNRLAFLKKFYQYAYENSDEFQTSWTAWLASKGGANKWT